MAAECGGTGQRDRLTLHQCTVASPGGLETSRLGAPGRLNATASNPAAANTSTAEIKTSVTDGLVLDVFVQQTLETV